MMIGKALYQMNQYNTLLKSIPVSLAEQLGRCANAKRVRSGEVIATLGEPIMAVVVNGWFRLSRFDQQGGQYLVSLRRKGRFIGLESAVGADIPASEVIAFGPGSLLTWPREEFAALAHSNAVLAIAAARAMAQLTEEEFNVRHRAKTVGIGPRIAQLLLLYAAEVGESTHNGYRVHFPFNQHDLAEILEVRRESVSTRICQLEHANLIERCGRDLQVNVRLARIFLEAAGLPDDLADRNKTLSEVTQTRGDLWPQSQQDSFEQRQPLTMLT
jgi:CRP-like cAMP-binding protein